MDTLISCLIFLSYGPYGPEVSTAIVHKTQYSNIVLGLQENIDLDPLI